MKVWVVTSGSYSDYQIERIFLREEDATTYEAGDIERRVEEYDVVSALGEQVTVLVVDEIVVTARYGHPHETFRTYWYGPDDDEIAGLPACKAGELWKSAYMPDRGILVRVEGTDHERVRKVFSEKRAQAVAML